MRALLLFPPQWTAAQPHSGLASLNGQLRRAGHQVQVRDLNLEFVEHVLSPQALRRSWRRLQMEAQLLRAELGLRMATGDSSEKLTLAGSRLELLEGYGRRHAHQVDSLCEWAELVPGVLRQGESYYEPRSYMAAMATLDAALALYSSPYLPSQVRWNDFSHPTCPLNLAPLTELCGDRRLNPFIRFYEPRLRELLEVEADLVAISIGSFSQVVPGLTLALMLRQALARLPEGAPRPHLSLGGNFFSRLREALVQRPAFFHAFADSLTLGEGERPIVELAAALERPGGPERLERVPCLLYLEAGGERVKETPIAPNYPMEDMAFQELEGFPLERYLAPERVVCIRASKGCYWGQCTFCDGYYGLQRDEVQVERLVAEIRHLRDRYGVRHFEFVDQCLSPAYLEKMCEAFIRAELGVRWFCNARTEPGFTRSLLERMYQAGNTMLMWGVESASPRLLKLMRKGVSAQGRLSILRQAAEVGLWNFAYVFFGFPSETREEAQATIDLLREHTDIIHAYGRSVFTLGRHSPLAERPQEHGILSIVEDPQELSTNLSYEVAQGLQAEEIMESARRCQEQCREAYGDPLWMALRSREALHLYLAHHGRAFVQHHQFHQDSAAAGAEFVF